MGDSYIQKLISERMGGAKTSAKKEGQARTDRPVINLSVGEPDAMADIFVIEALAREASKWENRGHADKEGLAFKEAAAGYLQEVFGIRKINAETEVTHTAGTKSALAILPQAFINPGDVTIMTAPGYKTIGTMTQWLGGEVYTLPLKQDKHFLPDLGSVPGKVAKRAKLLYINYPNNPTGACATMEFYEQAVQFAKDNDIIVVQDAAFAALTYGDEKPLSFLSCRGAKKVGVELHSLSMAFNMAGWRLGFMAGNEAVIKAFAMCREQNDSGQYRAVQMAGKYALEHPGITEHTAQKYERRLKLLVKTLKSLGFKAEVPKAGFCLYVKAPKAIKGGMKFKTSRDFTRFLLMDMDIAAKAWEDSGNYVRFSVTYPAFGEDEEKWVMDEIMDRLSDVQLEW